MATRLQDFVRVAWNGTWPLLYMYIYVFLRWKILLEIERSMGNQLVCWWILLRQNDETCEVTMNLYRVIDDTIERKRERERERERFVYTWNPRISRNRTKGVGPDRNGRRGKRERGRKETYIITISHQAYCKTRNVPRLVIVHVYTL